MIKYTELCSVSLTGACKKSMLVLCICTMLLSSGCTRQDPGTSTEASTEFSSATEETVPVTKKEKPTTSTTEEESTLFVTQAPWDLDFTPCNELWYTTAKLNVRIEPDINSQKLTTLPTNTPVHCTGIGNNGWHRIMINGQAAYVSSEYLTRGEAGGDTEPSESEPENTISVDPDDPYLPLNDTVYTTKKLNLRPEPDENSIVIAVLPVGFELHRVGVNGAWTRVEINDNICYVASKYLSMTSPTQETLPPTVAPTEVVTVAPSKPPKNPPATGTITRKETDNGILYTGNPGPLISVDAGHQKKGNNDLEPMAPGLEGTEFMKKKVSYGTSGGVTKFPESQLNLDVSMRLKDALLAAGYNVLMIRESQEVDISNAVRTVRSNASGAQAFIHIHANGSTNTSKRGAETLAPAANNPYMSSDNIAKSRTLARLVIDSICAQTGMPNLGVLSVNNMTGINWSIVPVTTVEMGYMSNPTDEQIILTQEFQEKLVAGIVDGLDLYFGR